MSHALRAILSAPKIEVRQSTEQQFTIMVIFTRHPNADRSRTNEEVLMKRACKKLLTCRNLYCRAFVKLKPLRGCCSHVRRGLFTVESRPYLFFKFLWSGRSMLELNLVFGRIKDMQGRVEALRGYL